MVFAFWNLMAAQHTTYTTYIFLQGKMSVFLSVNAIRLLGHSVNAGNCMKIRHYAMYVETDNPIKPPSTSPSPAPAPAPAQPQPPGPYPTYIHTLHTQQPSQPRPASPPAQPSQPASHPATRLPTLSPVP